MPPVFSEEKSILIGHSECTLLASESEAFPFAAIDSFQNYTTIVLRNKSLYRGILPDEYPFISHDLSTSSFVESIYICLRTPRLKRREIALNAYKHILNNDGKRFYKGIIENSI